MKARGCQSPSSDLFFFFPFKQNLTSLHLPKPWVSPSPLEARFSKSTYCLVEQQNLSQPFCPIRNYPSYFLSLQDLSNISTEHSYSFLYSPNLWLSESQLPLAFWTIQSWLFTIFQIHLLYSFIYVFLATLGLHCCTGFSLVAERKGYSSLQHTGFSLQWFLPLWSWGSRVLQLQ